MFIKRIYSTKQKNRRYYYQLVKSYRQNGEVKHEIIANLGSLPEERIDSLIKSLNRFKKEPFELKQKRSKK